MARVFDNAHDTYDDICVMWHGYDILSDIMGGYGCPTTLPDGTFGFYLSYPEVRFWSIFAEREQEILDAYEDADSETRAAFDALDVDGYDLIDAQEMRAAFFGVE